MHEHEPLIQRAPLIDAATSAAFADAVCALRSHWIRRDAAAFYTFGAALYLDAPRAETLAQFKREAPPADQYAVHATRFNPLLETHFAPLYAALADALAMLLDAPVRYAAGLARPGFHIYEHADLYAAQRGHVPHFDRQYECTEWSAHDDIDFSSAISVTLPLRLPAAGGGLRVWDLNLFDVQAAGRIAARELASAAASCVHRYCAGELVCHRGHLLHQVAPWPSSASDQRITLQAHGLYFDGAWQLYW